MMNQGDDQRDRAGYPEQRQGFSVPRRSANMNKYPEKNGNYSPSTSFRYNPQSSYSMQGGPRKRQGYYDGGGGGGIEKIARQNDIIIRLLKEIRDHLVYGVSRPPQPANETANPESAADADDKVLASSGTVEENATESPEAGNEKSESDENPET